MAYSGVSRYTYLCGRAAGHPPAPKDTQTEQMMTDNHTGEKYPSENAHSMITNSEGLGACPCCLEIINHHKYLEMAI